MVSILKDSKLFLFLYEVSLNLQNTHFIIIRHIPIKHAFRKEVSDEVVAKIIKVNLVKVLNDLLVQEVDNIGLKEGDELLCAWCFEGV